MYAYWVCAARETPIFSPEFPFRSISFSQITKKSVPEHHHFKFFGGFCRSGDHHFQNFNPFIASHGRLPRQCRGLAAVTEIRIFTLKTAQARSGDSHFHAQNGSSSCRRFTFSRSKRLKLVPEPCIFTLKTDQARSGAPHFHAQNGSSSFRSPAFSRSKRLKLVPEPHIFTLDRELVPEPLPIFHFAAAHTKYGVSTPRGYVSLYFAKTVLHGFYGMTATVLVHV